MAKAADTSAEEPKEPEAQQQPQDSKNKEEEEYEALKQAVDEVTDGEDVKVEAVKATMQKLLDMYSKKSTAAKDLLKESMKRKEKLRELEKEKEENERKALEETEEFKKLYEDMKPKYDLLQGEIAKTMAHFEEVFNEEVETLTPEHKALIPENMDLREKIAWVRKFKQTIGSGEQKQPEPKKPSAGTSGPGPESPPPEGKGAEDRIREELKQTTSFEQLQNVLRKYGRQEHL